MLQLVFGVVFAFFPDTLRAFDSVTWFQNSNQIFHLLKKDPNTLEAWVQSEQNQHLSQNLKSISNGEKYDLVVVGSGFHAFFLISELCQKKKCLVIEGKSTHSTHFRKGFWLNTPSYPQQDANHFPGGAFQPAHYSESIFLPCHVLWASLVLNYVFLHHPIFYETQLSHLEVGPSETLHLTLKQKHEIRKIQTRSLVFASGLSSQRSLPMEGEVKIKNAIEFLQSASQVHLPFSSNQKIAVVGGGDSALAVIERLLGLSPFNLKQKESAHPVEKINWFTGQRRFPSFRWPIFRDQAFLLDQPKQFQKIKKVPDYVTIVRQNGSQVEIKTRSQMSVLVNEVVNATGLIPHLHEEELNLKGVSRSVIQKDEQSCAQRLLSDKPLPIFFIGASVTCSLVPDEERLKSPLSRSPIALVHLKSRTQSFARFWNQLSEEWNDEVF